jgi:hypothetical protein
MPRLEQFLSLRDTRYGSAISGQEIASGARDQGCLQVPGNMERGKDRMGWEAQKLPTNGFEVTNLPRAKRVPHHFSLA